MQHGYSNLKKSEQGGMLCALNLSHKNNMMSEFGMLKLAKMNYELL